MAWNDVHSCLQLWECRIHLSLCTALIVATEGYLLSSLSTSIRGISGQVPWTKQMPRAKLWLPGATHSSSLHQPYFPYCIIALHSTLVSSRLSIHSSIATIVIMPPRRRDAVGATQSTLAFGNQSRVTKPSTVPTPINKTKKTDSPASLPSDKSASGTPEPQHVLAAQPSKPHVAELAVRQQARKEQREPRSEEDTRALKLQYKDLRQYWTQEEKSRGSPRSESGS